MTLLSAATLLFLVMDPLGNIPLFLAALRKVDPGRHRAVILREALIALGVMVAFLFAGPFALDLLQVSPAALTVSGGIVLLLIAIRMIFPERSPHEDIYGEPFIVPLAVPYIAGPSVVATELLLLSRWPERWPVWLAALILAWLASTIILYLAGNFRKLFGDRGLTALERLMGMLLVTVAVEMMMQGAAQYLGRAR